MIGLLAGPLIAKLLPIGLGLGLGGALLAFGTQMLGYSRYKISYVTGLVKENEKYKAEKKVFEDKLKYEYKKDENKLKSEYKKKEVELKEKHDKKRDKLERDYQKRREVFGNEVAKRIRREKELRQELKGCKR